MVDTGVFIRWFLKQDGFEHARELRGRLVGGDATAETVDFARIEVAGVFRKKALLTARFTPEEFTRAVRLIDDIGVVVHKEARRGGGDLDAQAFPASGAGENGITTASRCTDRRHPGLPGPP